MKGAVGGHHVRSAMPPCTCPDPENPEAELLRMGPVLSLVPLADVRPPVTRNEMK
jgi:hypothetical protein